MFKKVVLIFSITILVFIGAGFLFLQKEIPPKSEGLNANEQNITIGGVDLLVDVADEPSEQSQGLSGRDIMAENKGMLFVFPQSLRPAFWMRDMKFSLDFIWIDENGTIIEITKNVSPATYPKTFSPASPIKYEIEVNAGWVDRNKIEAGDKVSL